MATRHLSTTQKQKTTKKKKGSGGAQPRGGSYMLHILLLFQLQMSHIAAAPQRVRARVFLTAITCIHDHHSQARPSHLCGEFARRR